MEGPPKKKKVKAEKGDPTIVAELREQLLQIALMYEVDTTCLPDENLIRYYRQKKEIPDITEFLVPELYHLVISDTNNSNPSE